MSTSDKEIALKDLCFRMADDDLILGHRNSEWTGLGPILEEDIAFSSMAQDKLGYAQAFYSLIGKYKNSTADALAFTRGEKYFTCCRFVEYPIGEYDFSLMRHFLFDNAEAIRFDLLTYSSDTDLANLAKKFRSELKYHTMHANLWIEQMGNSNEETNLRMQSSLNTCMPQALGIFENGCNENKVLSTGIFKGEKFLRDAWLNMITPLIEKSGLKIPDIETQTPEFGGRMGYHTEYLQPLLDEMNEVFSIDPNAEW